MKPALRPRYQAAYMAAVLAMGCTISSSGSALAQSPDTTGATEMQNENIVVAHDLSLFAAQKLLAQGLAIAAERDTRLSIAIVDRAGNLLAFARMDGASLVTTDVAQGKARTAAFLKAPSKLFEDMINSGAPSMATVPGLLPLQGGIPVMAGNEVIGAVGVSGSSGDNDQAVATQIAASFADL